MRKEHHSREKYMANVRDHLDELQRKTQRRRAKPKENAEDRYFGRSLQEIDMEGNAAE